MRPGDKLVRPGNKLVYRAVLWDKDGTLVDSLGSWVRLERELALLLGEWVGLSPTQRPLAAEQVLTALGVVEGRPTAQGLLASGTPETILTAFYTTFNRWTKLPELTEFMVQARQFLEPLVQHHTPDAFPGLPEIVRHLAQGGILQGVGTSDSVAGAERELGALGLLPFFTVLIGSDHLSGSDQVRPKPHPDTVFRFARLSSIPVEQLLVIGDTPADEEMALTSGADFWGVLWGTSSREDFRPTTRVLTDPTPLKSLTTLNS